MQDLLNRTGPYHWTVDAVRYFTIAMGVSVAVFAAAQAWKWHFGHDPKRYPARVMFRVVALGCGAAVVALEDTARLGLPWVWWRLPLFTLFSVNALAALIVEHREARQTT